jgi:hypothetical protein
MKINEGTLFDIFICALIAGFVILSFQFSPNSRAIPLLVGILTMVGALIQLLANFMPNIGNQIAKYGGGTLIKEFKEESRKEIPRGECKLPSPSTETLDKKVIRIKELEMYGWLLGFLLIIYLFGYIISIPVFTLLFLILHSKAKWFTTLILTVTVTASIYSLFVVFLEVPLWRGIVFGGLGY